jgi:hypothetical protein
MATMSFYRMSPSLRGELAVVLFSFREDDFTKVLARTVVVV